MRILICGSRTFRNKEAISRALRRSQVTEICHGAARGADALARDVAQYFRIPTVEFPANWAQHGKRAGMIRNKQMLDEFQPRAVFAFVDDPISSAGTANMLLQAVMRELPVYLFDSRGHELLIFPSSSR